MDESDTTKNTILAIILVISTLAMVVRLWQDWIVAVSTGLMMISLAGLILSLCRKIKKLETSIAARERTMRINLEEVSKNVNQRCDAMSGEVEDVIEALSRRVYR
jgi:predicted Holliday junction resolvase-like endonuclease